MIRGRDCPTTTKPPLLRALRAEIRLKTWLAAYNGDQATISAQPNALIKHSLTKSGDHQPVTLSEAGKLCLRAIQG